MRKHTVAALSLLFSITQLAGCSSNLPNKNTQNSSLASSPAPSPASSAVAQSSAPSGGKISTGLAVISSAAASKNAGDEDGLAEITSNVVAVLVDEDGRIVDCRIDAVQSKVDFDKDGKLLSDLTAAVETKQELGEAYGLKQASGIGKEWNEQADALASYVTGKTMEEVKGIALNDRTAPADGELAASVTISVGDYIAAIEKAVNNARPAGAKAGDHLGLGIVTSLAKSKEAGEEAGLAQADSTYAAASFDSDGRITSCILDGSVCSLSFDADGKITSDTKAGFQTKNELGEEYGMKQASSIGKEWNEQAAAYAQYALGKTMDELSGIAVTERGAPADAELSASVTISVGDFNVALKKAAKLD